MAALKRGILVTGPPQAPSPLPTAPEAGSLRGWRPLSPAGSVLARLRLAESPGPASPQAAERAALSPHTHEHLARGYLRGQDSAQPIGRSPAALVVGREVVTDPGNPRHALREAGAVLSGGFIRPREEPAAALEAGDELGILQAPQQLGHGAPGTPLPLPRQGPLLSQSLAPAPAGSALGEEGGRGPGSPPTGAPLRS